MSGNGQDRVRPEPGPPRPEPVEAHGPGASTSSARSRATGNRCVRHLNAPNMAHLLAAVVACGDKRGRWRSR